MANFESLKQTIIYTNFKTYTIMKKITLLFTFLFAATCGFAQDVFPTTWESGEAAFGVSSAAQFTGLPAVVANTNLTAPNTSANCLVATQEGNAANRHAAFRMNPDGGFLLNGPNTIITVKVRHTIIKDDIIVRLRAGIGTGVANKAELALTQSVATIGDWDLYTFDFSDGSGGVNADVVFGGSVDASNIFTATYGRLDIAIDAGLSKLTINGGADYDYYIDDIEHPTALVDDDGDTYLSDVDCDDTNPAINPGASEILGDANGDDENCDGNIDDGASAITTLPLEFTSGNNQAFIERTANVNRYAVQEISERARYTVLSTPNGAYGSLKYNLSSLIDISTDQTGSLDILQNISALVDGVDPSSALTIDIRFTDNDLGAEYTYKHTFSGMDNSGETGVAFTLTTDKDGNVPAVLPQTIHRINIFFNQNGGGALTDDYFEIDNLMLNGTPLGVQSFDELGIQFSYAPNPASDNIRLNSQKEIESVSMYNFLGQQVLNKQINALEDNLDISSLRQGVYFMKATIEGTEGTFKIIKK